MKIFIAGATGALGSRLVPMLVQAGHDVVGTSRSRERAATVDAAGGHGVVMDGRDLAAVHRAVLEAAPDVVVHQLTSLAGGIDFKHFDESFAVTNELRTRTTDALIAAAEEAGTGRIIVQSFTGWANEHTGSSIKTEADPLDPNPAAECRATLAGIAHVERAAVEAGGIALRYGGFYGPGQSLGEGGELLESIRARNVPIVGGGTGIWSFIHIEDAAAATAAAVERGTAGRYNIVDDEPAPVSVWLPELARLIGAKAPRRLPAWLARPMIGDFGVAMMTTSRGSSNAKAKAELGWSPRYASWRDGFRRGLGDASSASRAA
ncbi:NAD-dependent epimerase/dehydratase family protein [Agromyces lapidis]|uniref:NAD-dependent epimerase/dehydratase family protein n=1 Tax=Agromyces lapidis TaxID=279574 RepID=A0ABV5SL93_9MICO|nr:NAD(P)-dependent oxidoreductase [Agromyces lapidis]